MGRGTSGGASQERPRLLGLRGPRGRRHRHWKERKMEQEKSGLPATRGPATDTTALKRYQDGSHITCWPQSAKSVRLNSLFRVVVNTLAVSPSPDAKETHNIEGRLALASPTKKRLGTLAGISVKAWPVESGHPDIAKARARGAMRMPDGSLRVVEATKVIDARPGGPIEEEIRCRYARKLQRDGYIAQKGTSGAGLVKCQGEDAKTEIELRVREELSQWRKHKDARADTGAKDRAIEDLLGLKKTYTAAELTAKPFAVAQVALLPDLTDPTVRNALAMQEQIAMGQLYGSEAQPAPIQQLQGMVPDATYTHAAPEAPDEEAPEMPAEDAGEAAAPAETPGQKEIGQPGPAQEEGPQ